MDPSAIVEILGRVLWGLPMLILLLGTGLLLTVRLRMIQVGGFPRALSIMVRKARKLGPEDIPGDITPFQALTTSLAGTVGNGNIAGVATAIAAGGPGALFWMWVSGFLGMATKYAESYLGVKFRKRHSDGTIASGPMYYIAEGAGLPILGSAFAFFLGVRTLVSTSIVQTSSIAIAFEQEFGLPHIVTGVSLSILTWLVVIGGIRRIGRIAEKLSPLMVILYLAGGLFVVYNSLSELPEVFALIMKSAFSPAAATGGFAGATVRMAVRFGIARGIYSNEAGTGSAPIAHGAARTRSPKEQGLLAMMDVFVDTLVVCTLTGLVILMTGMWSGGETSTALTRHAFETTLPGLGLIVVAASFLFGYSTLISWPYYGEQCFSFLFGDWIRKPFRWAFCIVMILGTVLHVETVWNIADTLNGLGTIPNLVGVLFLSGLVVRESMERGS